MHSSDSEVSYFAAGVFAHLFSDGLESWPSEYINPDIILKDLVSN
jgi:hypothetical protein